MAKSDMTQIKNLLNLYNWNELSQNKNGYVILISNLKAYDFV